MNCSSDQHVCVSPRTNQLICISIVQATDGKEDCPVGIDEPALCREMYHIDAIEYFHCWNKVMENVSNLSLFVKVIRIVLTKMTKNFVKTSNLMSNIINYASRIN